LISRVSLPLEPCGAGFEIGDHCVKNVNDITEMVRFCPTNGLMKVTCGCRGLGMIH
jgi:hypothetical protein